MYLQGTGSMKIIQSYLFEHKPCQAKTGKNLPVSKKVRGEI